MLEVRDLSVSYGHVRALSNVSISVGQAKVFAVLGANGAGKTTLLRSIMGLTGASGHIEFDGADITQLASHQRARCGIALVPEGRRLFPDFTIEENLKVGAITRQDRSGVEADIDEMCALFPILRKRFNQRARTLSGGEGQMLAIGRALLLRPKLLLLDEPSVGLMPTVVAEIFSLLGQIAKSRALTVLVVEQNAQKALSVAEDAAVLELGQIAFSGRAADVAADPRVKEAYLGK